MWILQDLELGLYLYKMESQMHMLQSYLHIQGVSQEGKNPVICMNWEIKCNWGCGEHCEPFSRIIGEHGGKPLEHLQYLA